MPRKQIVQLRRRIILKAFKDHMPGAHLKIEVKKHQVIGLGFDAAESRPTSCSSGFDLHCLAIRRAAINAFGRFGFN